MRQTGRVTAPPGSSGSNKSVDLTLLASLSDRGRGRLVPLRPAGACRGILPRPDLDVYVERRGAYRKLPVKLLRVPGYHRA